MPTKGLKDVPVEILRKIASYLDYPRPGDFNIEIIKNAQQIRDGWTIALMWKYVFERATKHARSMDCSALQFMRTCKLMRDVMLDVAMFGATESQAEKLEFLLNSEELVGGWREKDANLVIREFQRRLDTRIFHISDLRTMGCLSD